MNTTQSSTGSTIVSSSPKYRIFVGFALLPRFVERFGRDEFVGDDEILIIVSETNAPFSKMKGFPGARRLRKAIRKHLPKRISMDISHARFDEVSMLRFADFYDECVNDIIEALTCNDQLKVTSREVPSYGAMYGQVIEFA